MFFLVEAETSLPADMTPDELTDLDEREAEVGTQLAIDRKIINIWRVPGRRANVGIWSCRDADELHAALSSLPAWPWMSITVRPLATHPLGAVAASGQRTN